MTSRKDPPMIPTTREVDMYSRLALRFSLALALALSILSCSKPPGDGKEGDSHAGHAEEAARGSFTLWGEKLQLFVEHAPLVSAQPCDLLVHVTQIDGFKAVSGAKLEAVLRYAGAGEERFGGEPSKRAGIYKIIAKPGRVGPVALSIRVTWDKAEEEVPCGDFRVYPDLASLPKSPEGEGGEKAIPFLMEQQWTIPFETAVAAEKEVEGSTPGHFTVEPLPSREAQVFPLQPGLLVPPAGGFPLVGSFVNKGQPLAYISPALDTSVTRADLEARLEGARADFQEADSAWQRAQALIKAEAISEKQYQSAQKEFSKAKAYLLAAEDRVQDAQGKGSGTRFPLLSPIAGTLVESWASGGAFTSSGKPLFRVADLSRVRLRANISESDYLKMGPPSGGRLNQDPSSGSRPLGKPVAVGSAVDATARTIPVWFELDNADRALKLGMVLQGSLISTRTVRAVAVPKDAILTENGTSVAYVQIGGESFARRAVSTGASDGEMVAVTSGLAAGERVVSKGAYDIRLSSLSGVIPTHGHAH